MYPTNLEELVKWFMSQNRNMSYALQHLKLVNVTYGDGYPYQCSFICGHTEMIPAYINSRFEELSPTLN